MNLTLIIKFVPMRLLNKRYLAAVILSMALLAPLPAMAEQSHVHDTVEFVDHASPLAQFRSEVPANMVQCPEGLELIMKKSSGAPACVRPASVQVLIERGWGIHVLPDYDDSDNNSDMFAMGGEFAVTTDTVVYFENYTGYLAVPDAEGEFPGIVMIHEWWGLNDNIKDMAEELASHGYVVLAVDLFGKAATTADQARQLVSAYDPQLGIANMNAAVDYLKANYGVQKVGSIGWCFGGGQSLNLALNNHDMDATVIYYGSVTSDKERLASINWPILGIFAGLDQGIPVESVKEFEKSLDDLGVPNEIYIYPNVNHAFANPSGDRYAPQETKDAWQKTIAFLKETLQ
ncbi:MAG: dienelactone hydrolase family protein [Candidatus Nitrosotenuis sp.]